MTHLQGLLEDRRGHLLLSFCVHGLEEVFDRLAMTVQEFLRGREEAFGPKLSITNSFCGRKVMDSYLTARTTDLKDLEGRQVPGDGVEDGVADFHTGSELCQLLHEGLAHENRLDGTTRARWYFDMCVAPVTFKPQSRYSQRCRSPRWPRCFFCTS